MPTALVVEDHEDIIRIHKTILKSLDFDVEIADTGQAALDYLEHHISDLIILDMNLPLVSGHYIYKRIRSDSALNQTSVIICTANELMAKVLSQEIPEQDRIVIKPIGPRDLIKVINGLELPMH